MWGFGTLRFGLGGLGIGVVGLRSVSCKGFMKVRVPQHAKGFLSSGFCGIRGPRSGGCRERESTSLLINRGKCLGIPLCPQYQS